MKMLKKCMVLLRDSLLLFFFVSIFFNSAVGQITFRASTPVFPSSQQFTFDVGEPFGTIQITIEGGVNEAPDSIVFNINENVLPIPESSLNEIQFINNPSFGVVPDRNNPQTIEEFRFVFESAPEREVIDDIGFPGCDAPCTYSEKSIAVISLDDDFNITVSSSSSINQ